jgi:hypothetical protein
MLRRIIMKRTITIALAAAVALSMTACSALDAILQVNILKGIAALKADDIADADADTLLQMSNSGSFYDALADDPAVKAEVLDTLDAGIVGDADTADEQELAILAADILLRTTAAGDLVNKVAAIAADLFQETIDTNLQELIVTIVPASLLTEDGSVKEGAFLEMVDALLDADAYYQKLGNGIPTGVYAPDADISASDAGNIAQSALIAAVVAAVVPTGGLTTGEYLFSLLTSPNPEVDTFVLPNMESGYLGNLLKAAGLTII